MLLSWYCWFESLATLREGQHLRTHKSSTNDRVQLNFFEFFLQIIFFLVWAAPRGTWLELLQFHYKFKVEYPFKERERDVQVCAWEHIHTCTYVQHEQEINHSFGSYSLAGREEFASVKPIRKWQVWQTLIQKKSVFKSHWPKCQLWGEKTTILCPIMNNFLQSHSYLFSPLFFLLPDSSWLLCLPSAKVIHTCLSLCEPGTTTFAYFFGFMTKGKKLLLLNKLPVRPTTASGLPWGVNDWCHLMPLSPAWQSWLAAPFPWKNTIPHDCIVESQAKPERNSDSAPLKSAEGCQRCDIRWPWVVTIGAKCRSLPLATLLKLVVRCKFQFVGRCRGGFFKLFFHTSQWLQRQHPPHSGLAPLWTKNSHFCSFFSFFLSLFVAKYPNASQWLLS